jgi:2-polyprenyl-3-methyl-5-hydroxy-6-metoxy-1,4-benzoquinol methylase
MSKLTRVSFPTGDARKFDTRHGLIGAFNVVVCRDVIEHLLDDT